MDNIISAAFGLIVILIVLIILGSCIKVVPQSRAFVVERLGAFRTVWGVGLHIKVPLFERVAKNVSLKEQVVDFPPQPVITKDNVTMQIDNLSGTGQVNVAGQIWSARSAHDVVIPRETEVRVLKISGVKVLVEAI